MNRLALTILGTLLVACSASPPPPTPTPRPPAPVPPPALTVAPAASAAPAPPSVALHLALGPDHACALKPTGEVQCWGDNVEGQLADGTAETRPSAARALFPADTVGIAAGDDFTCALDRQGSVRCFGAERPAHFGEMYSKDELEALNKERCARGDKVTCRAVEARVKMNQIIARELAQHPERRAEVEAAMNPPPDDGPPRPAAGQAWPGFQGIQEIAAGGGEICAREATGSVRCMALAAPTSRLASFVKLDPRNRVPSPVPQLTDATRIAVGGLRACALRASGDVVCWHRGGTPEPIAEVHEAVAITLGARHACALLRSHEVACWGNGEHGQLGESAARIDVVVRVRGLVDAVAIAAGGESTCATRASGAVVCWGALASPDEGSMAPVEIEAARGAGELALGDGFACAAMPTGAVRCWGKTSRGRLGRGTMPEALAPREVEGLDHVASVQAFTYGTCALRDDATVACWGSGYEKARGAKAFATIPGLDHVASLSARDYTACAVQKSGKVVCIEPGGELWSVAGVSDAVFAAPSIAQLCVVRRGGEVLCGDARHTLYPVPGVSGLVDAHVGASDWACGRKASGSIACWETPMTMPDAPPAFRVARPPPLHDVVDLTASGSATCAVRRTGALECFGSLRVPMIAVPDPGVRTGVTVSMSESNGVTCVLQRDDTVACAGLQNRWGERGDGPLGYRDAHFTKVAGLTDVRGVDVGADHACAVKKNGTVVCWGNDDLGQVSGRGLGRTQEAADVVGL